MVAAPGTSRTRGTSSPRLSGTAAGVARSATRATGTLTNSTHRQPNRSVINPPPTMPTTNPTAAPQTPGPPRRGREKRDEGSRHVDEQHPPPTQQVRDHPPSDHADHEPEGRHPAVDSDGAVSLLTPLEDAGQERERGRH